jgi:hypothetical protein
MTGGILFVAAGFGWLSAAEPGQGYAASLLPGVLLWGLGIGLAVTPLTAAVLAAVGDADRGEASGINDTATGSRGYAGALAGGYQPAMIVMAGLCVAAALITAVFVTAVFVTAVFVTDDRQAGHVAGHRAGGWAGRWAVHWAVHWAGHRLVPRAPGNGCPPPVPVPAPQEDS